jgi:hypothetical protein
MDDEFYREEYGATVWSVEENYFPGSSKDAEPYMLADKVLTKDSELPVANAFLHIIESSTPKEGLLILKREEGNIAITGDYLQNWSRSDEYFNLFGRFVMWLGGFFKAHNVGIGWYYDATPKKADLKALLDLDFEHVLPGHGDPCISEATKKYEKAVDSLREQ